ncbi:syntaxin-binding protein [Cyberlindnera jadinii NRRL Y-1542]|uniref:Sec1-like protein n=1 Tax=Cyberlindnera jadinii (strain ATCC 18201 / CBS 1600 / BCRC 20928 / JCM 3617 / NBRC 0987 / NRRL Y-1542) TaxID=983966 RepID=A0A1E4RXF4_CYBJN|nr:Sec1-like protein [Cyberlindnera jadinii NRRL Y-1542]ODV71926.1 Sec1-like protein [Cyberlindnera jadinii NRRL Y-1542]
MSQTHLTLRDRQTAILEKMLNLNINAENSDLTESLNGEEIIWKVLVLDSKSTAIISSVLRMSDLLRCGITMHTHINANRSPLPDVPVIYFVEPTRANIDQIAQDLKEDKYASFYINFTSSLSRDLLEDLAKSVAMTGKSSKVMQVYDQYLSYIVTEPSLFSLKLPDVYARFASAKTTEEEINSAADIIANGLFDTIITMGSIPIIRSQSGGPAQLVSEKLDQKLRDYVISTKYTTGPDYSQRLVLILFDRNIDLAAMFSHSWIYQCLVADVFKLESNTITIETEKDGKKTKTQYDLEPKDFFWNANAQLPFPDAVDNADTELKNYKEKAEELTRGAGAQNLEDLDNHKDDLLQQTVNQLPELTARKNIIDMHMNVLLALLNELKAKGLDSFFEIEQSLSDPKSRQRFLDVLRDDGNTHNLEDKLRTFIVMYLTTDLPSDYVSSVEREFAKHEEFNTAALSHIKKLKDSLRIRNAMVMNTYTKDSSNGSSQGNSGALLSSLSSKLYNLADGKISEGVGSLISGVKRLLPEKKAMPITKLVETLMDPNNATEESLKVTDDYLYYDPKVIRGSHSRKPKRQTYLESVVFVVGGGNYLEYQNLQEWAQQSTQQGNSKQVVYGSDDIYSPSNFLKEITLLE